MSGQVAIDHAAVEAVIAALRTRATTWGMQGSALAIDGVGPDVRDAVDASVARWSSELATAGEATGLAADRVQRDLDAFVALDAALGASEPAVVHGSPTVPVPR